MFNIQSATILLNSMVQKEPQIIVGPVAKALGYVLNIIYNMVSNASAINAFGFSIILLTIFARILMLPMAFKQQKSTVAMQMLTPEINKIKKKYGDSKDPEVQKKISVETQALYAKHKINPFASCLPVFIQMPIFFALTYIMQNAFLYIQKIGFLFNQIAQTIIDTPNFLGALVPLANKHLPANGSIQLDMYVAKDVALVLNRFKPQEWVELLSKLPQDSIANLQQLLTEKDKIDSFFGLNLIENAGLTFPGIIIPLLAFVTSFISAYLMNQQTKKMSGGVQDSNTKMTQNMMLIMMPAMMAFMTISFPIGVGLYWITTNTVQLFQQMFLTKFYSPKVKEIK